MSFYIEIKASREECFKFVCLLLGGAKIARKMLDSEVKIYNFIFSRGVNLDGVRIGDWIC
jgi:hypothetical protein